MKIFISHSSADVDLASALAELFQRALGLSSGDIVCTSVDAHKLRTGEPVSPSIRKAIEESEAFVAIVTRHSLESVYVLFEMGARWGKERWLAPLIGPDLRAKDVSAPLSELNMAFSSNANDVHRLVDEVAEQIGISAQKHYTYSDFVKRVTAIKPSNPTNPSSGGDASNSDVPEKGPSIRSKVSKLVLVILLATVAWHFAHELIADRIRTEVKKANSPVLVGSGTLIELITYVRSLPDSDSNITPVTIDLSSTQSARPLVEAHNQGRDAGARRAPVISLSVASLDKLNWSSSSLRDGDAFYAVEVKINNPLEVVVLDEEKTCGHVLQPEPSKEDLDRCFLSCIDGHKDNPQSCKVYSVTSSSGTRTQQGLAGFTFFKKLDDLQPPPTDLRAARNGAPQDVHKAIAFGSAVLHLGYHERNKGRSFNVYQQCGGRWKRVKSGDSCDQLITAYLIGRYPDNPKDEAEVPIPEVVCDLFEMLDKAPKFPDGPIIEVGKHPSRREGKSCRIHRPSHTIPFVWRVGAEDSDYLDLREKHSRRNGVNLGQS